MRVWGLYSSHVGQYEAWELIDLFASEELARTVQAELIGKQAVQHGGAYLWYKDPDGDEFFDDLHVSPIEVRGLP